MTNIFVAVFWNLNADSALEEWYPELLVKAADTIEEAKDSFDAYINRMGLCWEHYAIHQATGDGLGHFILDLSKWPDEG